MGNDMFNDEQLAHMEIVQKETEDAVGFWKERALKAEAALAAAERDAAYNADEVTRQNHLWSERCETAEAERDALRSRLAEMDHLGTGAARSAG